MRPFRGLFASGLSGLLLASASGPALATVIDDFEEGPFSFTTAAAQVGFQAVTAGVHCIGSARRVTLDTGTGNTVFAQLMPSVAVPDDEVQSVFTAGGGTLEFYYQVPATDLTAAGTEGRLDVEVTTVDPFNFQIELVLEDSGGASAAKTQSVYGPGLQSFFLSDFAGVDATHLTGIRVRLWTTNLGDLHVSDIRMRTVSAAAMGWETVDGGPVTVPPYPQPPISFSAGPRPNMHPPDPILPLEVLEFSLVDAQTLGIAAPVGLSVDGESASNSGTVARVAVSWNEAGIPFSEFDADLLTTVMPPDGVDPHPQDPVLTVLTPTAFRVEFDVDHDDGGDPVGTTRHDLLFEIGDQSLEFTGVSVSAVDPVNSDFHTLFHVRPTGDTIDLTAALYGIRILADLRNGGGGLTGVEDGAVTRPLLAARPSVMRGMTHLQVGDVGPGGVDLTIHDVAGRLVTRLHAVSGQDVTWRGTTRWGTAVPPGVYLVRAAGAHPTSVIRLVKLP